MCSAVPPVHWDEEGGAKAIQLFNERIFGSRTNEVRPEQFNTPSGMYVRTDVCTYAYVA